jgi:hypothetical protein
MAEGIADYLATNPHRQPLVIHCNGTSTATTAWARRRGLLDAYTSPKW